MFLTCLIFMKCVTLQKVMLPDGQDGAMVGIRKRGCFESLAESRKMRNEWKMAWQIITDIWNIPEYLVDYTLVVQLYIHTQAYCRNIFPSKRLFFIRDK